MSKKRLTRHSITFQSECLEHYLKVYNRTTGRELGYLGNISRTHLMLMSRWPLQTNSTFKMRIVLPSSQPGPVFIDFDACCQWSRPDADAGSFDSGCLVLSSSVCYQALFESLRRYFSFSDSSHP